MEQKLNKNEIELRQSQKRTLLKNSLLLPASNSRYESNEVCSWTARSTLSTCSLVYWAGGSENVTVPSAEICAVMSSDSIYEEYKECKPEERNDQKRVNEHTMLRSKALTSSSESTLMSLPMSDKCSVTYVAVSFFNTHRGARCMA